MRNTWLVIRREYLERVRTKAFLISTLLVPIFMLAVTVGPQKLAMMKTSGSHTVVVVASSQEFGNAFLQQLNSAGADADRKFAASIDLNATPAERDALRAKLSARLIDGFIWATDDAVAARKVTYMARETSDFMEMGSLRRAVTVAAMQRRLAARGLTSEDVNQLLKPIELDTVQFQAGKESKLNGASAFLLAFSMVIFLYTTLLMYGITVMRSVLEEKSSRIIEVLLASISARALMVGKIVGVGAVGLTQVLLWAIAGAVFSAPALMAAKGMGVDLKIPIPVLIFFPIFFVLGYLLYSANFAALGASVNSEQEAQQFQMIVMMPIIFSIVMMMFVIRQPNAPLSVGLSMFPFTAPIIMYLRIVVQTPPMWQIATCLAILLATIYGMMSLCARIYRVGILMYGKRPTLPEIMKWLRYA
jgi:ABC-2 type transport system permease protein